MRPPLGPTMLKICEDTMTMSDDRLSDQRIQTGRNVGNTYGTRQGIVAAELHHPTEPSRFALALTSQAGAGGVALFVVVSLREATVLWSILAIIAGAMFLLWVAIQFWRIRLLG